MSRTNCTHQREQEECDESHGHERDSHLCRQTYGEHGEVDKHPECEESSSMREPNKHFVSQENKRSMMVTYFAANGILNAKLTIEYERESGR